MADNSETPSDPQGLQRRIDELEQQLAELGSQLGKLGKQYADLQARLEQGSAKIKRRFETSRHLQPLLYLVSTLLLAGIPAGLVFRDRWLGDSSWSSASKGWCGIQWLCHRAFPAYFAVIFACVVLLILLVFVWKRKPTLELAQIEAGEPEASLQAVRQHRLGTLLSRLGLVVFLIQLLLKIFIPSLPSWPFLFSIVLFGLGAFLLEISLMSWLDWLRENWRFLGAYLLAHLALLLFLADISRQRQLNWVYPALLLLGFVGLLPYLRRLHPVLWLQNLALALYAWRINSWAYSLVGDDFAFYMKALEIYETDKLPEAMSKLLNGVEVYGSHPYLSSLLQELSMRFFGADSFAWRISSLYLSSLAILAFYYFFSTFISRRIALLASFLLACSSYLMTFGKIGYNNLQSLFAMSLILAAATWAVRKRSNLAYVALGFSLGFCLYVYPAAITVMPLPILLLLSYAPPRGRRLRFAWASMLVAFGLLFIPLILQPDYWASKMAGLFVNNPELVESWGTLLAHFAQNIASAVFSFLYVPQETHFVAAGYVDALSAVFVLLGLVYTLRGVRKERFLRFLFVGWLLLVAFVGAAHDRPFPPNTRMFLFLPWFAVFAAIGIAWVQEQLAELDFMNISQGFLRVALAAVLLLNLFQAYGLSPRRSAGAQSMEVLFVRLVERIMDFEPYSVQPKTVLFFTDQEWGIDGYYWLLRVYNYPASRLHLMRFVVDGPEIPAEAANYVIDRNTLIIVQPWLEPEWREALFYELGLLGKVGCEYKEYTGKDARFVLWYSPGLSELCR